MTGLELAIRGFAVGLIIAAPVGPVNILCIQRTSEKGWKAGLVCGLGAAVADTIYGSIAGFSISFVIQFLTREETRLRLAGGFLLLLIGLLYLLKPRRSLAAEKSGPLPDAPFTAAFLLALTNPTTVLSFLAVLAILGVGTQHEWWATLFLVSGIFCGSMAWWVLLTGAVNRFRQGIDGRSMRWLNRIAGLAIGALGLANILLAGRRFK